MGVDVAEGHWVTVTGTGARYPPGQRCVCRKAAQCLRTRTEGLSGAAGCGLADPTLRVQGYGVAVGTAAGALAIRRAQVLEVTTTVGEAGTGLAQPGFTEGEGGPVTLWAGPVVSGKSVGLLLSSAGC